MDDGGAIHLDHVRKPARLDRGKFAIRAKSGIVDEQLNFNFLLRSELKYFFRGVSFCQVCHE